MTASESTSIAKTFAAEAIHRIVDRAVQLCGGRDVSDNLLVARLLREVRRFRIYDGASKKSTAGLRPNVACAVRASCRLTATSLCLRDAPYVCPAGD